MSVFLLESRLRRRHKPFLRDFASFVVFYRGKGDGIANGPGPRSAAVHCVSDSLVYYLALKNAGVPVEMHLYAEGKHAFGLRRTKFPITRWTDLVETWLRTIGMIPE
jgi:acetyl esterase/lipase